MSSTANMLAVGNMELAAQIWGEVLGLPSRIERVVWIDDETGNLPYFQLGASTWKFFWRDKCEGSEFTSASEDSGSYSFGTCEAKSQLHGTAPLFSRFLFVAVSLFSLNKFVMCLQYKYIDHKRNHELWHQHESWNSSFET